ncbi:MAG TPA: wax ester/triacylglycerol synthase family O-acyltransferase [Ramlibacter sp.]|nr:wax ester/triacylglycerol synthase family O-acyltransferase [Ramlibacter sp.]
MHHLSGLDATFLYIETPEMPMHVGSVHLFDLPDDYEGDFYDNVREHLARRMHLAPLFQRKLALMPFELANPVWVDDEDVDLDYHVRRVSLARPGSMLQLEQMIGRLHSSLIDRSRPLWEFYVIEGFHTGQVAFYTKIHHAAMDGQAGVLLGQAIFDLTPVPRVVKPPRQRPRTNRYQLGMAELAGAAISNTVTQYVKLARMLPDMGRAAKSLLERETDEDGKRRFVARKQFKFGPRTPINGAITNQRSFASANVSLAEVKEITRATDTTVNDVVLAVSSAALRRYLADENCRPAKPLIAGVPVSLREAGNTDLNNQVSMMFVGLATDIKDPLERLAAIHANAIAAKEVTGKVKTAIPMDFPSFGAPWLMSGLASLYGRSRIANVIPPMANVAISNVPGSPVPLYLAGAKVATYHPVSIPGHGVALNITVQSYNGVLGFGLTACRRAVPDPQALAAYLTSATAELLAAVRAVPASKEAGKLMPKVASLSAARASKARPGSPSKSRRKNTLAAA